MLYKFFIILFLFWSSSHSHALIGGEIAKREQGEGIFQIGIKHKVTYSYNFCTATKIGPNAILTAAHCFINNQTPKFIKISSVIKNKNYHFEEINVKRVFIHNDYSENDTTMTSPDVAIIFVEPNIFFQKMGYKKINFNFIEPRQTVEYWGYGCQKSNNSTDDIPVKKLGKNITLGIQSLRRNFGKISSYVHATALNLYQTNLLTAGITFSPNKSSLCSGDSGGPVFLNNQIVGINLEYLARDAGDNGKSKDGLTDINLHLRLSKVAAWIKSILKRSGQNE